MIKWVLGGRCLYHIILFFFIHLVYTICMYEIMEVQPNSFLFDNKKKKMRPLSFHINLHNEEKSVSKIHYRNCDPIFACTRKILSSKFSTIPLQVEIHITYTLRRRTTTKRGKQTNTIRAVIGNLCLPFIVYCNCQSSSVCIRIWIMGKFR